jgi:hypothetical protein
MDTIREEISTVDQEDDFRQEYATAITGDELRQRMYKIIDAWEWEKKRFEFRHES